MLLTEQHPSAEEQLTGLTRARHFSSDRPNARYGEADLEDELFRTTEWTEAIYEEYNRDKLEVALD